MINGNVRGVFGVKGKVKAYVLVCYAMPYYLANLIRLTSRGALCISLNITSVECFRSITLCDHWQSAVHFSRAHASFSEQT